MYFQERENLLVDFRSIFALLLCSEQKHQTLYEASLIKINLGFLRNIVTLLCFYQD